MFNLKTFDKFNEGIANGSVHQAEALLLASLCYVICPKSVLNIGYFKGMSARAFLEGMPADSKLISVDIDRNCVDDIGDPRHKLLYQDQVSINKDDMELPIDVIFCDASHLLELNKQTFTHVKDWLRPGGYFIVHDTGAHFPKQEGWGGYTEVNGKHYHHWDEVLFVQWIQEHNNWPRIDFNSERVLRHGLTFFQKPF